MNWLYHKIPQEMKGTKIIPLNSMKDKYPELYAKYRSKYNTRENLLKEKIVALDCLWNDVVFLSSVHPKRLKQLYNKLGGTFPKATFVKINPYHLTKELGVMGSYKDITSKKITYPFDPKKLDQCAVIGKETIDHYKERIAMEKLPLFWKGIPHIFYKGSIDISTEEIINI